MTKTYTQGIFKDNLFHESIFSIITTMIASCPTIVSDRIVGANLFFLSDCCVLSILFSICCEMQAPLLVCLGVVQSAIHAKHKPPMQLWFYIINCASFLLILFFYDAHHKKTVHRFS